MLGQTAAAMVLLVGAGLLVNSFWRVVTVDPGLAAEKVLLASLDIPEDRYVTAEEKNGYRNELIRRLGEIPGVAVVGASRTSSPSPAGPARTPS